jgi:hypothetical protein
MDFIQMEAFLPAIQSREISASINRRTAVFYSGSGYQEREAPCYVTPIRFQASRAAIL